MKIKKTTKERKALRMSKEEMQYKGLVIGSILTMSATLMMIFGV